MHPWRERLQRWFTPLASHIPLSPNAITLLALAINLIAACVLAWASADPRLFLVAPGLIAVGGLLDGLDGVVARKLGLVTAWGDFLDHFCDRVSDLALLAGWMIGTLVHAWLALPILVIVALHGYAGTQIEASFHERSYEGAGRGEFIFAVLILPLAGWSLQAADLLQHVVAGLSVAEWLTVALGVVALGSLSGRIRRAFQLSR